MASKLEANMTKDKFWNIPGGGGIEPYDPDWPNPMTDNTGGGTGCIDGQGLFIDGTGRVIEGFGG